MVRVRKLVLAIAAASALSSGVAHALGLGEVTLRSTLNQPLDAEIELLEVRDLSSDEVLPKLGSAEDFIKAGVDRQYFLTDLKFTPIVKANGRSAIRVTSSKAVREPYLNFLVEVLWPNGRLLREYTLLLDPPLYSPQTAAAVVPQIAHVAPVAAPAPRPAAAQQVQRSRPQPQAISGNEYRVTNNDTLWEIAQRVGGGSVHQTMLAIADLNPDAFIGGNINRMKTGQVLRLPDEQQVRRRSNSEAVAEVTEHNNAWRQGRAIAARQLDATHKAVANEAPAAVEVRDNLKLVAADAGQSASGSEAGAAESKALADSLAITQESLDSSRSENAELNGRLEDLQSQLEKLQKLVELKDNQLAQMQANMAAVAAEVPAPVEAAPVAEPVVEAVAETVVTPEPVAVVEPVAETPAVVEPEAVTEVAEVDYNYNEEPEVSAPVAAAEPAPVEPEQVAATPVEPAPASFVDDLLANPTNLGLAGGGILALLLGLMVLSRRNASKEAELQAKLAEQNDGLDDFDPSQSAETDSFTDFTEELAESEESVTDERVSAQTADVLGEADIYIAYGRFNQAAELLQNAIDDEPQRTDLRLKLMEVQAELADRDAFARQERELREIGGVTEELEQLRAKFPAMTAAVVVAAGAVAAAEFNEAEEFDLDGLEFDEPVAPAPVAETLDDSIDLSFDSFDTAFTGESETAVAEQGEAFTFALPEEPQASESTELGADFDLSFDGLDDLALDVELNSAAPAPVAEPASDLADEFLLDLDAAPAAPQADELEAFSLDLNDPQPALEDLELSADFDLSLGDEAPESLDLSDTSFANALDGASAELEAFAASLGAAEPSFDSPSDSALSGELDAEDDFDFLSGTDETATKLDLARAYIDMGDSEGARDILDEVVAEGNDAQQNEAREMIAKLV